MTKSVPYNKSPRQNVQRTPFCYGITNLEWLNLKALYFFEFGALGSLIPFIVLFYKTCGLSASQIGIIELLFTFVGSISRPLFGSIADKTSRHRVVLGICLMVFTIMFFTLNFVRPTPEPVIRYRVDLSCNTTTHEFQLDAMSKPAETVIANLVSIQPEFVLHHIDAGFQQNCSTIRNTCQVACRNFLSIKNQQYLGVSKDPLQDLALKIGANTSSAGHFSAFQLATVSQDVTLECNNTQAMPCEIDCGCSKNRTDIDPSSYTDKAKQERKDADNWRIFLTVLLLRSIGGIPFGPSISLADSITYDVLGPKHRSLWGQQRMWGTLAWGVIASILGLLIDAFHTFNAIFYVFGACGIGASLVAIFWLPKRMPIHSNPEQTDLMRNKHPPPVKASFGTALCSVFKIPIFCISCFVALISGMFLSVLYVVWPILIIHDLHGTNTLIGVAAALSCGLEVPSLFFAGHVVNFFGETVCFLLMLLAYMIRCVCYAYLTPDTVWLALPLEALHIFCFAFYWAAATRLAATIAPPGTSATVQAILQACYFGLGMGLGNLVTALIYEVFGRYWAFLIYAAFAASIFVILLILYFAYIRKAIAKARSHNPERMGSFSPQLNPDASYMDDEDVNEQPLDTSGSSNSSDSSGNKKLPAEPLITSIHQFSEL